MASLKALATVAVASAAVLAGCASPGSVFTEDDRRRILQEELGALPPAPSAPAPPAPPAPRAEEPAAPDPLAARVTLTGVEAPLHTVLTRLAERAGLRLVLEREIAADAPVTVSLKDVAVRDALRVVLTPRAYYARVAGDELVVYAFESRTWAVPVPAMTAASRTEISNSTTAGATAGPSASGPAPCSAVSSAGPAQGTSAAGGQMAGVNLGAAACVGTRAEVTTWGELDAALRAQLSPEGTLTIHRALGLVTVRERPNRLADIDRFLERFNAAAAQQVSVSVHALEVALTASDTYGVDWSRVWRALAGTTALSIGGSFAPLAPFSLAINEPNGVSVLIRALSTQGKVRVLNQPSIRLVHGLPAVIQVGRVQTFLASSSTTTAGVSGTTTTSLELGSVQDGVILPITAYVVGDEVILNLAPIVTRVRQIREVRSGSASVEAPELDNRSVQTTVRLRSGETIVFGGFIANADTDSREGLPLLLRHVPVLGWLFGHLRQSAERTEVVLTLTPTILPIGRQAGAAAPAPPALSPEPARAAARPQI
jgi:type IVB pilus formation R64 PilN family outer membrane protein